MCLFDDVLVNWCYNKLMVTIVSSSTRKASSAEHRLEVAVPRRPTQWHVIIVRLRHADPALFDVMSPLNQSFSVHHVCTRPIVALSSHALTKMLPRIRLILHFVSTLVRTGETLPWYKKF